MKVFKLSPDQKKWAMTACLLATLSFNLSHLLDGTTEGSSNLASQQLDAAADAENQAKTEGTVTVPAVTQAAPTPKADAKPVAEVAKVTKGIVKIDGKPVEVNIFQDADGNAAFKVDKGSDPRKVICASCANGVFTSDINYNSAISNLTDSLSKAEDLIKSSVPQKAKEVDLASMPVDQMTEKQKAKRADQLLTELQTNCDKEKAEASIKCYSAEMKTMLKDPDNKVIFKGQEDKVETFVDENIKNNLIAALKSSKFSSTMVSQIDKLSGALPGKFQNAREIIINAATKAVQDQEAQLTATKNKAAQLLVKAQAEKKIIDNPRSSLEEKQQALEAYNQDMQDSMQLQKDSAKMRLDLTGSKMYGIKGIIGSVRSEEVTSLNSAVSKNYIEQSFSDHLLSRYDELTNIITSNAADLNGTNSADGSRLLPPVSNKSGTVNSNGVQSMTYGKKLLPPAGTRATTNRQITPQNNQNQFNGQINSFNPNQQSSFSGSRPQAPVLNGQASIPPRTY
jgi:hypothetical protein